MSEAVHDDHDDDREISDAELRQFAERVLREALEVPEEKEHDDARS